MKKYSALLTSLVFVLGMSACQKQEEATAPATTEAAPAASAESAPAEAAPAPAEGEQK